jgi:hypothetical protein
MNNSLLKSGQHSAHHFWKLAIGNLAGFEKLSANSKALGAKQQKNLSIQYEIKGTVKKKKN